MTERRITWGSFALAQRQSAQRRSSIRCTPLGPTINTLALESSLTNGYQEATMKQRISNHDREVIVTDLENRFNYHPPQDDETITAHQEIRVACLAAALAMVDLPNCREKSLAFTHLETAMFWGNAAIARNHESSISEPSIKTKGDDGNVLGDGSVSGLSDGNEIGGGGAAK